MQQRIEVPANWTSIAHLMAFTDKAERVLPLSDEQNYVLRLVVEEIATNIVKYGYSEREPGVIQINCACENGRLQVVVRDHGRPFDPRKPPDPDLGDDPMIRTVGGLGVFLVREFADDLTYHHDPISGWNELVVVKGHA